MKEILFEFEEFKDRIAKLQKPRVHSAYRRKNDRDGLFASFEFRMYCSESENNLLVFEKTLGCLSYEEDTIKAFRDECRGLSESFLDFREALSMTEDHVCPVHGIEEHSVMEYGLVPRDIAMFSVRINRHFCSIDVDSGRSFYSPLVDVEDPLLHDRFDQVAIGRGTKGVLQ